MQRWPIVIALPLALVAAACSDRVSAPTIPPEAAALGAMLDVRANGCGPNVGFGTATLIDDTLALTAAHVVAGADRVAVIDLDGVEHDAHIVFFDPDQDLAALRVPAGLGEPVGLQSADGETIDRGVVAVSRGAFDDRVVTTTGVEVPRHVNVATTDIYLDREVMRPGFEVTGEIEPGDSGAMVVAGDGAVGVIWSRSNSTAGRAWAVDVPDDFRDREFRRALDTDADHGPCLG